MELVVARQHLNIVHSAPVQSVFGLDSALIASGAIAYEKLRNYNVVN